MTTCAVSGWGADGPESLALSRTARFLAWHEYSLRTTELETGETFEFDIDDQDAEGIPPSWSASERFLAFLGYDEEDDYTVFRFDRFTEISEPVDEPGGAAWCEPARRALTRAGRGVFVTCYAEGQPASAYLVTMPS
jgi:hypothetical protein